jgi:signal transduction histidine kinase
VIEGTLDIARIEGGKLTLDIKAMDLPELLQQIVGMFELQARNKGLSFEYRATGDVPRCARRRKTPAPDPDQHHRQCRQIYGARWRDIQCRMPA